VFEGAPAAMRWLMKVGWRVGLGMRLDPPSSESILGWKILGRAPDTVVVEQHSWLLSAQLVWWIEDRHVTQATFVRYARAAARPVWSLLSHVHRQIVPYVLRHAVKTRNA
jgi:hypothetical protein